jgi:hypothetical protein
LVPNASQHLACAINEQTKIGWDNCFCGRISSMWGDLYTYDINNSTQLIKFPSTERWGREIVSLTLQFAMECWYARNNFEHQVTTNPVETSKAKLIEEIIWLISKKKDQIPATYMKISKVELMGLPRDNLSIMKEQLRNLQVIT